MNSLQELNYYSNIGVPYADDRPYSISFSANTTTNSNISIFENQEHTTIPGINIVNVTSTPRDITLSINVASVTGANVVWRQDLPGNVTVSNSAGVFTASGLNGRNAWDIMKYANVQMPILWANNWSYVSTITYPNVANVLLNNTYSWTTNVSVTGLNQLEQNNGDAYYPLLIANVLQNTPSILDLAYSPYATNGYTLTVSSNNNSAVANLSSTGDYATSSFNIGTGNLTIIGNLQGVNNHLQNLIYYPTGDSVWQANYTLTNPASNYISTTNQIVKPIISVMDLTSPNDYYYPTNVANIIQNSPSITVSNTVGYFGNVILTLTPNSTSGIGSLSSTGDLASSAFNSNTKVLTITGTSQGINNHLANITYQPVTNYDSTWMATYKLNPGTSYERTVNQTIKNYDARYLSQPLPLTYDTNRYIGDGQVGNPTITDTISNPSGTFTINIGPVTANTISYIRTSPDNGLHANGEVAYSTILNPATVAYNNTTKTMVISGTKNDVNAYLERINFLPATDNESNFDVRYTLTVPTGETVTRFRNFIWSGSHIVTTNYTLPRNYVSNSENNIFSYDPPQIYETTLNTNPGNESIYKIALTLTSGNIDTVGTPGTITGKLSGNLVLTGLAAEINNHLDQKILYYPPRDSISTQTLRFRQWRNNVLQIDSNISISGSARTLPFSGAGTQIFTGGNTAVALSYEQAYYMSAKATLIGGGGGGGGLSYNIRGGCGGGGGGRITEQANIIVGSQTIYVTVGYGGPTASAGGASTIKKADDTILLSAAGGGAGVTPGSNPGGAGGTSAYSGGAGGSTYYTSGIQGGGGGGGGGAGGAGSRGGNATGPSAYPPGGAGGNGGIGKAVTLHTAQLPLTYAAGGGGGAGGGIQQYTVLGGTGTSGAGNGGYYNYATSTLVVPTVATRYGSGGGGASGSGFPNNNGANGYAGVVVITFY